MTDDSRSMEFELDVPGTPEEVWQAIATGPGISSWYVPHVLEERVGGVANASFGPGMDVEGQVLAWEPNRRLVLDGGTESMRLAFEWLVEARDGGGCVVRLVTSGFGPGAEWDDFYDGMSEGWPMFLANLALHLEHFAPDTAQALLPLGMWAGPRDTAWKALTEQLGLPAAPSVGEEISVTAPDAPTLRGVVTDVAPSRMNLLLTEPVPGTAFLAAEGSGEVISVSVWLYLYGDEGRAVAEGEESRWQAWLADRGLADPSG